MDIYQKHPNFKKYGISKSFARDLARVWLPGEVYATIGTCEVVAGHEKSTQVYENPTSLEDVAIQNLSQVDEGKVLRITGKKTNPHHLEIRIKQISRKNLPK